MEKSTPPSGLDPTDWTELRRSGHRMLEDMFDHLETLRDQTLWQPPARHALASIREALPRSPTDLADVHTQFLEAILPYSSGNAHPGFMGWVQGGGSPVGMLADMLAAGMNANLGGRHHMAIEVERQVLAWTGEIFGFPATSSGLLVTGTSAANFIAVLVARTRALGNPARQSGLAALGREITAYTSAAAHGSIARSMEMVGLGRDQLRLIAADSEHRIGIAALRQAIARDRAGGKTGPAARSYGASSRTKPPCVVR